MGTEEQRNIDAHHTFPPGRLVVVSLANPREKFWGAILELTLAGLSARGIDLLSFDDFASLVRAGSPVSPTEAFFPMHRIERVEADFRNGDIPSIAERFQQKAGKPAAGLFHPHPASFPLSMAQLADASHDMERGALVNRAMTNRHAAPQSRKRKSARERRR